MIVYRTSKGQIISIKRHLMDIIANTNTESENRVSSPISVKNIDPITFFEKDADFVFV